MTFSAANTIWVLLGAALVFFMQAGFAMCEAGLTRAKNTGNILMKNLLDFCIGTPLYWLVGFGIMFGAGTAAFGWIDPFIMKDYSHILPAGVPLWAYAIFQTVFCATSATIVSGAMAERTKLSAYCIYSAAISLFIYPVSGHWIWGGGWLAEMGFYDFAGSTCVHMVGGVCALIGAKLLGPRIGKYGANGKPRAILGHNLSIAALDVFIPWFCWFGFNGASTVGMDSDELIVSAGLVFFNTNLAAAVATLTTMIFTWLRYGKPNVSMTFNASLAGLVGIMADSNLEDAEPVPLPVGDWEAPVKAAKEKAPDAPVYTNVRIICRPASLEPLKKSLNKIGVTGMTVTNVMGYGAQKGKPEYYRGTPVEITLLPKVQVDIVVSKVPVRMVVETAKRVLHTGHIGDGKIFVSDVENVVRVRTGEEGYDALQSD